MESGSDDERGLIMWWFLKKIYDDNKKIIYAYGSETRDLTGEVEYDRVTESCNCNKLADGDTENGVNILFPHVWGLVNRKNTPQEYMVACG